MKTIIQLLLIGVLLTVCNQTLPGSFKLAPEDTKTVDTLSEEEALSAIRNYCFTSNPGLEDIVNAEEYPTYWMIDSSDDHEIVVLFRSYTGAKIRYYIDRATGDAYITEFVPGITTEEQQTDVTFNVKDYSLPNS